MDEGRALEYNNIIHKQYNLSEASDENHYANIIATKDFKINKQNIVYCYEYEVDHVFGLEKEGRCPARIYIICSRLENSKCMLWLKYVD